MTRPPSRRLGADLFLAFASLLIAFVIWTIAKRGDETVEVFSVPLRLTNVPTNVTARIEPETVKITLRVPNRLRARVQTDLFRVECDFVKQLPEPRGWCGIEDFRSSKQINLDTSLIHVAESADDDVRRKIQFVSLDGGDVTVKGKLITRPAKLEFPTKGDLAPGYRLAEPIKPADPGVIYVTASAAVFKQITENDTAPVRISTEEIDLTGQKASFDISVSLRLPANVELVYPEVHRLIKAQVAIEEITSTVENVPVVVPEPPADLLLDYSPHVVAVSVRGPQEVLKRLKPSDFIVRSPREILPAAGLEVSVPLEATFLPNTPKTVTDVVGIRNVTPDSVSLKFSLRVTPEFSPVSTPASPGEKRN
jgi:YbbR domain-containing protein